MRVCLNTIVRATKELDSARVRILSMGARVRVIERKHVARTNGKIADRVKIASPCLGWCSIEASAGFTILAPLVTNNDTRPDPATDEQNNLEFEPVP